MKKQFYVFLTLRLLKMQRLRTATIFCGMLFSAYLLCAFAGFGYEFWRQVHFGTDADTEFDATEGILILLVAVVLLLVVSCAAVLLANLFSLTFSQRWKSLGRLVSLGADVKGLFVLTFLEVLLLFGAAAPVGLMLARLTVTCIGIPYGVLPRMVGGVLLAVFLISCMCARKPLLYVRRSLFISMGREEQDEVRMQKRRRLRVAVTVLAAILLYVPADYVISTNLAVHRSELHMKYRISYSASPQDQRELAEAVDECGQLAEAMNRRGQSAGVRNNRGQSVACNGGGDTVLYVLLSASAKVKANVMSRELCGVLKKAGWAKQPVFTAEGTVCFLEDQAYEAYVRACGGGEDVSSVLVNRYVNRGTWTERARPSFQETRVLKQAEGGALDAVTFFYRSGDGQSPADGGRMTPGQISDEPPDGMDFDGSLTLVVPLSGLEAVCLDGADVRRMQVCGKFEDAGEGVFSLFFMPKLPVAYHRGNSSVFSALEACLGEHPVGSLQNTRKASQEWYASMHGLHLAMRAISGLLFFMAVLNLFAMIIFQYTEQRRGLAIRWSLGAGPRDLLKFLVGMHLGGFFGALAVGGALSVLFCRLVYGIFRSVWRIGFVFPGRQVLVAVAMALVVSLAAVSVDGYFISRQRFLEDIRRAEW